MMKFLRSGFLDRLQQKLPTAVGAGVVGGRVKKLVPVLLTFLTTPAFADGHHRLVG